MEQNNQGAIARNSLAEALALFDRSNSQSWATAFEKLGFIFNDRRVKTEVILEDICNADGILEVVFAGLPQAAFDRVAATLKSQFPENNLEKYESSISKGILRRLTEFFRTLSAIPDEELEKQCRQVSQHVDNIHSALYALRDVPMGRSHPRIDTQKAVTIDAACFHNLSIECPQTPRDAQKIVDFLLRALKTNLEYFLRLLRNGQIGEVIRRRYFRGESTDDRSKTPTQGAGTANLLTLSYKKAALLMKAADDFGDQRVLMSSRFIRDLRHLRSRPRLFSSILSTLRSLSQGSVDEQVVKSLATSGPVTIFAARISQNFSLVFCTDYSPSLQYEGTDHVQRVFGVYHKSVLQNDFWAVFAAEISARREQEGSIGVLHLDNHTLSTNVSGGKPIQHADQMRSLLVINKFVDLSQNVLHAIQNDEEILQAFELSTQEQRMLDYSGSCYVLGRSGTGKTTIIVMKILATECTFVIYPDMMERKPHQLFVTRSQTLATKVSETYKGMYQAHVLGAASNVSAIGTSQRRILVDADEELRHDTKRFGELGDDNFPLFVSFDRLCSLLEEEIQFNYPTWSRLSPKAHISYDIFLHHYWPKMQSSALRGIDPSLVFGQFIGVIQGSEGSLDTPGGFISREQYVNISRPAAVTHSEERHNIYDLFVEYKRQKARCQQHDIADRTHRILKGLAKAPSTILATVDFLFVDEAQDNLLIDTRLLRLLCSNPDGLFWAGDTAQTVFAGSAFTFNELTSFMWSIEREMLPKQSISKKPKFFELTVNFRSQQGILACAQSVLDCLMTYWPASIDKVPKEEGLSRGTCPLLYVQTDCEGHLFEQLIRKSNSVEFGAEQCIIVRNDQARDELIHAIKDVVSELESLQILTLYESKGLEYNDVMLYNFFADSYPDTRLWRHLLTLMTDNAVCVEKGADFDAIARELKSLYVGCTRARNTLWILDTSVKVRPMQHIWEQRGEIDVRVDEPDISQFASASNKSLWESKASQYFARGYWRLAQQAYRNAGLFHEASIATAYHLRECATRFPGDKDSPARRKAYEEAAHAFNRVASAISGNDSLPYYRIAAECFLEIPDDGSAATAFENGHLFSRAIELHYHVGDLERTLQLLRSHSDLAPEIVARVRYDTQLFCLIRARMTDALSIFATGVEISRFAVRHGLHRAEIALLEHLGDISHAARRRLQADQPIAASNLLKQIESAGRISEIIPLSDVHAACWRNMSIATIDWNDAVPQHTKKLEALEALVSQHLQEELNSDTRLSDLVIFRMISRSDKGAVGALSQLNELHNTRDRFTALLWLSRLVPPPKCLVKTARTVEHIFHWLQGFIPMCGLLRDLCRESDPSHNSSVQHILGFRCITPTTFRLLPDSAIGKHATRRKTPLMGSEKDEALVTKEVLRGLLASCLSEALIRRVMEAISISRSALVASIKGGKKPTSLRTFLDSILLMAVILDDTRYFEAPDALQKRKHMLLNDVYSAFTCLVCDDSSEAQLNIVEALKKTRDARLGIRVIRTWIHDSIVSSESQPRRRAGELMRLFVNGYALRDGISQTLDEASYLRASRCVNSTLELDKIHVDCLHMCMGYKAWSPLPVLNLLSCIAIKRLTVDIDVLCTTIEFVTGWLALLCSQRTLRTLAGTMLLKRLLPAYRINDFDPTQNRISYLHYCKWLVLTLPSLLREMLIPQTGASAFLQFKGKKLAPDMKQRHEFVARVCEAAMLLGQNVPDGGLRQDILTAITSLYGVVFQFPKLYKAYIAATTWAELEAALSSTNHLAVLVASSKCDTAVNRPEYVAVEPRLPLADRRKATPQQQTNRSDTQVNTRSTAVAPGLVAVSGQAKMIDKISLALDAEVQTRHRLFAAIFVQRTFRRKLALRKPKVYYKTLGFLMTPVFEECLHEVDRIPWPDVRYRRVFLGLLPHVLVCLDATIMHFEHMKAEAAKRLLTARHRELGKLGRAVTAIHDHLQVAKVLRDERLNPQSVIYRLQAWKRFKEYICEVSSLIQKLPQYVSRDIVDEWAVVEKHVVQNNKMWL